MKRKFLTLALLAMVAIGGAFASTVRLEGNFWTSDNNDADNPNIKCVGEGAACSAKYIGVTTVYTEPGGQGTSFNLVGSAYTYQP